MKPGDHFRVGPFMRQATIVSRHGDILASIPAIETVNKIMITPNPLLAVSDPAVAAAQRALDGIFDQGFTARALSAVGEQCATAAAREALAPIRARHAPVVRHRLAIGGGYCRTDGHDVFEDADGDELCQTCTDRHPPEFMCAHCRDDDGNLPDWPCADARDAYTTEELNHA